MKSYVPPGCELHTDVLQTISSEHFGSSTPIHLKHWNILHSVIDPPLLENHEYIRVEQALAELQKQLFSGVRTACYIEQNQLIDVERKYFLDAEAIYWIAPGKLPESEWRKTPEETQFYLRTKGYKPDPPNDPKPEPVEEVQASNGGRPNKRDSAVAAYWGAFPAGHKIQKDFYWKQALARVNDALRASGQDEVRKTSFVDAVKASPGWLNIDATSQKL